MQGITTGIIGDVATVFSCIVGMDNEIAGIFLVALGTSLPDTFASILAIKVSVCLCIYMYVCVFACISCVCVCV